LTQELDSIQRAHVTLKSLVEHLKEENSNLYKTVKSLKLDLDSFDENL